ncbi:MAG: D-glycero-D-manno-heptose 1,7-bisphosphate phosphatase [Frankiales bacterium]|nr:D-glycero-D-manno-heptose 1,7-bisphosphate phosphatase [Frankiales bacterium]
MTRRPAVFLDRDGVLNEAFVEGGKPAPPRDPAQFRILPGVIEACSAFAAQGLALVVVTNQPDVARGTLRRTELEAMHAILRESLPLDEILVCDHDDADGCPCRKPRPGMILDAAQRLRLDLNRSVAVGDRWRDIDAARRAGVHAVHIEWDHGETLHTPPDATFSSLFQASEHILAFTTSAPRPRARETTA